MGRIMRGATLFSILLAIVLFGYSYWHLNDIYEEQLDETAKFKSFYQSEREAKREQIKMVEERNLQVQQLETQVVAATTNYEWELTRANSLDEQLTQTKEMLGETASELLVTSLDLDATERKLSREQANLAQTQTELSTTQQSLTSTKVELSIAQQDMVEIRVEAAEVQNNINYLLTWISSNAEITPSMYNSIHSQCGEFMSKEGSVCSIDVYSMGNEMRGDWGGCLDFVYVKDINTSEGMSPDIIYDTQTFWQTKEGDCEDFSLFFVGWIRREYEDAVSQCGESNVAIRFKDTSLSCPCEFFVVCGKRPTDVRGHCEVGVVNSSLTPFDGVAFFNSVEVIEPQSGNYDGISSSLFEPAWNYVISDTDFVYIRDYQAKTSIQRVKDKLQPYL